MPAWLEIDWSSIFSPKTPLPEILIRGTVMYLGLFLLLRFVLKRQAGNVSLTDLLLIVLIADASQNAMASSSNSITDGILLVCTLIFWDYALDWLGFRVPVLRRLIHPAPLLLISNGQIQKRNMERELITVDQLMSQLRKQGVSDVDQVEKAYMEGDGHISVVKKASD